jgi:hypothetical protein
MRIRPLLSPARQVLRILVRPALLGLLVIQFIMITGFQGRPFPRLVPAPITLDLPLTVLAGLLLLFVFTLAGYLAVGAVSPEFSDAIMVRGNRLIVKGYRYELNFKLRSISSCGYSRLLTGLYLNRYHKVGFIKVRESSNEVFWLFFRIDTDSELTDLKNLSNQ